MAKKGAAGSAGRWGDDAWEEQNWDSVRKQEQMKQEVLIKASGNSERIRQMVRETEVTRSIGSETLQVLDQQSEQLARIHGEADKIEENLNFADRTIRGMESIWGSVKNMMAKPASSIKTSVTEAMRLEKASARPSSASAGGGSKSQAAAGGGGGVAGRQQQQKREYADDWQGKLQKMEDEQDKDLDHLGNLVGQLKNMGTDMGASLQAQTKSIERLSDRTDSIDARLGKSNMRIGRML